MKKLLYIILLLPLWVNAQINGTIQKTVATTTLRGSFGSSGVDTIPSVTGTFTNGYILKYNSTLKKWYASADAVGTVTSITPAYGLTPQTAITSSGTFRVDTAEIRTVANSRSLAQTQTALNLKANLASPTFTGNLTIASNSLSSSTNGLYQAVSDDYFKQYAYATIADRGEWVFESGDNGTTWGTTGQRWRFWYNATTSGASKDALIIDYDTSTFDTDLALGTHSLGMTGSLGSTGSRLTKGWFTDLQVTNAIAGSITGNAATVTTNANLTGVVTSAGNATSIADAALSIAKTSGLQTALDLKAPLASPDLTGTPTAPTATAGTNNGQLATTSFVTTADNLKANIASPTFTGTSTFAEVTATGLVTSSGGTKITGTNAFTGTGSGLELLYNEGVGAVQVYDRTGASYLPLALSGSTITIQPNGSSGAVFSSTGLAVTGTISASNLTSGTYTPTLTNGTNVASSTAYTWRYQRVGDQVFLSGSISITATENALSTELGISLPISSNFTDSRNVSGAVVIVTDSNQTAPKARADTTNDRISFTLSAVNSAKEYDFSISYTVL